MWTPPCLNIDMDRVFTPEEVNALLHDVEQIFQHMDFYKTRIQKLAPRGIRLASDASAAEVAEAARIRSQIEFLLNDVRQDVALIEQRGGIVKDLEKGLVDFPGRVDGEDVWLCWKRGESQVDFWHPLDTGFAD